MTGNKTGNGVTIIVCTNRPQFFDNILQNYNRQRYKGKELIIILNHDSMNLQLYRNRVRKHANVTVYQVPERISLGQSLNAGITRARFSLIAKFDDDDYYSPYYLKEQVNGLKRTKSDIVGKHSCLVYLGASKMLLVRSPKEKNKHVEFIQGGTLLFKREVLKKVRFTDRSIGEDVTFLRQCRKKGSKHMLRRLLTMYITGDRTNKLIPGKQMISSTWKEAKSWRLQNSSNHLQTRNSREE